MIVFGTVDCSVLMNLIFIPIERNTSLPGQYREPDGFEFWWDIHILRDPPCLLGIPRRLGRLNKTIAAVKTFAAHHCTSPIRRYAYQLRKAP